MTKKRKWFLWPIGCFTLIGLVFVGTGLWLFEEPFGWVQFFRGPESYRMDFKATITPDGFDKLHVECARLATSLDETNYCLVWPTNLPPVLGSLSPMFIRLHDDPGFMDVQVTGGFCHRGLLVSLNVTDTNVPSHAWFRGKIAPGVYEYKE
jgi:hypothetical protein